MRNWFDKFWLHLQNNNNELRNVLIFDTKLQAIPSLVTTNKLKTRSRIFNTFHQIYNWFVLCLVLLCFGGSKFCQVTSLTTFYLRMGKTMTMKQSWRLIRSHESTTLQWRPDWPDSVSNHQPHDCFLNRLFRHRSKETPKLRVTGLCAGNSP